MKIPRKKKKAFRKWFMTVRSVSFNVNKPSVTRDKCELDLFNFWRRWNQIKWNEIK